MLRRQLIDEVQSMANQGRASVDIAVRLDMTIEAVDEALGPADGCGFSPFVARKAKKIQDKWTDKRLDTGYYYIQSGQRKAVAYSTICFLRPSDISPQSVDDFGNFSE
jgi:hypothetical protein